MGKWWRDCLSGILNAYETQQRKCSRNQRRSNRKHCILYKNRKSLTLWWHLASLCEHNTKACVDGPQRQSLSSSVCTALCLKIICLRPLVDKLSNVEVKHQASLILTQWYFYYFSLFDHFILYARQHNKHDTNLIVSVSLDVIKILLLLYIMLASL